MEGGRPKRSVEDVWRELNAPRPVVRNAATTGIPGFGIPGVTTKTRILPKKETAGTAVVAAAHISPPAPASGAVVTAAAYNDAGSAAAHAGVTSTDLQSYLAGMQRTINCLTDPDRSTRRGAIDALSTKLLRGDATTHAASPQVLQAALSGPLLQPLVTMLSDSVERCRAGALQLLLDASSAVPDLQQLLPALLGQLVLRVGMPHPPLEAAEELRLQIACLVSRIVERAPPSLLNAHARELCILVGAGIEDAYHEIKKVSASALASFAPRVAPAALEPHIERLLQVLVAGLGHPHSRVRAALLGALDALMASGAVPLRMVEGVVAPGLRPLAADRSPAVREACFTAVARWMGARSGGPGAAADSPSEEDAGSRCHRYAPVLLPLLLLGVSDASEAVASLSLSQLESVGDAWESGSSMQVKKDGDGAAGATEAQAAGDQGGEAGESMQVDGNQQRSSTSAAATNSERDDGAAGVSPQAVAAVGLPAPYHGLPRSGARAMGGALLPDLLPPLLRDLREWTVGMRSAAARCLHSLLVLSGTATTPQLARLLPALCVAVGDEDADVATRVAACVRVIGALVPASHWLPLAVDALVDVKASHAARANALVVLASLLHAAGRAQQPLNSAPLCAVAAALGSGDVLASAAEHAGARAQLLVVIQALLVWAGPAAGALAVSGPLYRALMQLHGSVEGSDASGAAEAGAVRTALAQLEAAAAAANAAASGDGAAAGSCGGAGGTARLLCTLHSSSTLEALAATAGVWAPGSPALLAFGALLHTAPPECLVGLLPRAIDVMAPTVGDADADPALRLALLRLLDGLLESDDLRDAFRAPGAAAAVLTRLIMPPLVWRVGKVAAAVRFQAMAALATLVRRGLADESTLKAAVEGGLLPLLHQCLDEDWYPDVRLAAALVEKSLLDVVGGSLGDDQRRTVYVELLKRVDDSNNQVRIAACGALESFARSLDASYCDTNSGYLAAGLLIHMDDGDTAVAEAAAAAMEALAAAKPGAVAAEVLKARGRFRAMHYCDRVLAACGASAAPPP